MVRVNMISPGSAATPTYDKLGLTRESFNAVRDSLAAEIPLGRSG